MEPSNGSTPTPSSPAPRWSRNPWERQKGETAILYEQFLYYLKLGPERTYRKVRDSGRGVNWRSYQRWRWEERAEEWDRHIQESFFASLEYERVEAAKRQAKLGRSIQELALGAIEKYLKDFPEGAPIRPEDLVKLAEVGAKVESGALGSSRGAKETKSSLENLLIQLNVNVDAKEITD